MVGTNVVLNYVLIFGKLGLPALGISGAAIASSVSEAVSTVFFLIYTLRRVDYRRYGLFVHCRINWPMLRHVMSVSVWVMIQNGVAFLGWFVFFVAMEHHGERSLAVTNIVRSISSFLFMFVNAFASTNSSLVSNLIGAQKHDEVLPMCRRTIRLCYAFVVPAGILMAVFPNRCCVFILTISLWLATPCPRFGCCFRPICWQCRGLCSSLVFRPRATPPWLYALSWSASACTCFMCFMWPTTGRRT